MHADITSSECRHNHYINVSNICFENVAEFKCVRVKGTDQNYIHILKTD
jgi:hypothetical protein